ncbi:MAG: GAF and ANTAR domain-containing protein [Microbacterium sp.]|uniref:GAF and ANTAR domain-containing protein n=1 Tax=Microbacterium sp. TaxID=51671 RepID=UPI001ACEC79B|nr:GAF and ANTAR domain-containing protein [Microbacterium sp.]MBN9154922.1 GAF and ANTAR domain-containing protein [Microbacterium sp.]
MATRERELVETFVDLADTLVAGYDIVELLYMLVNRCAKTLDAADAGILLPNENDELEVVASTSERSRLIGLMQLAADEGPCVDAYRTGALVTVDDIASTYARWPTFATISAELGYQSMHAIPLRLRQDVIGSLNLFSDTPGPLNPDDAVAAQALADIATIGILHERVLRESDIARAQLQRALDSRVVIEQAKGIISHRDKVDMDEAFHRLRGQARSAGQLLSARAREIVDQASRPE